MDSRDGAFALRRRRWCPACGKRFSTLEIEAAAMPNGELRPVGWQESTMDWAI